MYNSKTKKELLPIGSSSSRIQTARSIGEYEMILPASRTVRQPQIVRRMLDLNWQCHCIMSILEDDPAKLLNAAMGKMDDRRVWATYSQEERIEYSLKILTNIPVYGYIRRIISA